MHVNGSVSETVVYSTDAGFWDHVYVSLYSLLVNNRDIPFDVRILAETPNQEFFDRARFLEDVHGDVRISWLPFDNQFPPDIPVGPLSVATYYRLLIDRLLPDTVDRILYLDGDTIVRGSIRELLDIDLSDHVAAATRNRCPIGEAAHAKRLGLPEPRYFNAGVLRINLDLWRRLDIGPRSLDYVRAHLRDDKLRFHDQDTLNSILYGRWRELNPCFNYVWWPTTREERQAYEGRIPATGPVIAHYAGLLPRAWDGGCPHPHASEYWRYRMDTPYADRAAYLRSRTADGVHAARRGYRAVRRALRRRMQAMRGPTPARNAEEAASVTPSLGRARCAPEHHHQEGNQA